MKGYKIGILGATGAVGRQMLNILEEYKVLVTELRLFASKRSVGKTIKFNDNDYVISEANKNSFHGLDFVFGAVSNTIAKEFRDYIVSSGAIFIDNSSAFRLDEDVPLVIPEINGLDVLKHKGVIANPNCSTIIALMAVNAINNLSPIEKMIVSTYQATSGAGAEGPIELRNQMNALINNEEIKSNVFKHQIVENVIPHIGSFLDNGYTTEEMKMQNEGRKILHNPNLEVSCTCVRVPVVRSHSISIELLTKEKLNLDDVKNAINNMEGTKLYDNPNSDIYPMPIITSNQDLVYVGRIRKSIINDNAISLWCSGDQVRKGAASNAIQIMLKLIEFRGVK